jgi:hypothetical protein
MVKFNELGMAIVKPSDGNPLQGIDFGVSERPLVYTYGKEEVQTSMRAIVRTDTGKQIGIVGEDYVVHDHRPGILHAVETLRDLGRGEVVVKHTVNKWGGRIFTDVFLPGKTTGKEADRVTPKFRFTSTYDGSKAVTVNMGLWRLICSNGMGSWMESEAFRRKHSREVTAEDLARALETVPEVYEKYQSLNKRLTALPLPTMEELGAGIGAVTAATVMGEHLTAEVANLNGRPSAWAAFQASTRWTTRADVSEEYREAMIRKVEHFFLPLAGIPV